MIAHDPAELCDPCKIILFHIKGLIHFMRVGKTWRIENDNVVLSAFLNFLLNERKRIACNYRVAAFIAEAVCIEVAAGNFAVGV